MLVHEINKDSRHYYMEINNKSLFKYLELLYTDAIIKESYISGLIPINDDKFLIKFEKRIIPLDDEDIIELRKDK